MFESPTINHIANNVRRSRVVRLSRPSRFFMQAGASKMQAKNSSRASTFLLKTSIFIQPQKQKFKGVRSGDSSKSILITIRTRHMHISTSYLTIPIQSPPTILTLPPTSPCMCTYLCLNACSPMLIGHWNIHVYTIYRVSQEECARLRENVPYVKLYRYNPKHLCPKLNGY